MDLRLGFRKPTAMLFAFCLLTSFAGAADEVDLLIVAGQSNAVGFDTKPSELPADEADRKIMFWWRCGDPPPDQYDSNSGKWTYLQSQPPGNAKRSKENRQYGNFANPAGGFGPEIGLARAIYAKEKKPLAVIKVAFSGTGMKRDWNPDDPGDGGACYRALISEVREAIALAAKEKGVTLRPRAFAWVQGESDANATDAPQYALALGRMLRAIRRDLKTPDLNALIAVNTKFGGGRNRFMPTIVAQQQRLAARDPHSAYVDTSSATIANSAHYDTKGTLLVGRLFAESLRQLEAKLQPRQRQLTIVTLGDSITKGVRSGVLPQQTFAALLESQLQKSKVSTRVINVGIGGERTDQALKRFDRVLAHQPDIVTIMYGTNDSYVDRGKKATRITREQYRANLNTIVAELLRRGIQPVLMTEPRWADDAGVNGLGEHPNVRLEPFVVACREVAKQWRVPLVDHFAEWTAARKTGVKLRGWTTDGCHPNPLGHGKLAAAMLPAVRAVAGPELKTRQKLLAGKKTRVVCFGDSVTGVYYHTGSRRAYTDMLGIALRRFAPRAKVEMINAGISGHTTVNAMERIDRDVLKHKPDLVTVMFGLNDMTRVPLESYRANLIKIVKKCRAAGAEVVLATPNNVVTTPGRPTKKLISYCDVVREVGKELDVTVCDTYREFDAIRAHNAFDWRLLMSDPIHPNMDGHKQIAIGLAQAITGARVKLDDVPAFQPSLRKTLALLRDKKPVRVLAMPPYDKLIAPAIQKLFPGANIKVESWPVDKLTVPAIELNAKSRVRAMKPDLVVIAVPRSATAASKESFVKSYAWVMNWSLNFGKPTWDCVVIHPSVTGSAAKPDPRDALVRRLVRAQDLDLIDRPAGSKSEPAKILGEWLQRQKTSDKSRQPTSAEVKCAGAYPHHLQGFCTGNHGAIFWSFTTTLVKTDKAGKVLKKIPVANHHGDLCFHEGKVYAAVNLGAFNRPAGQADSWVYVYDAESLKELARHKTPEVVHGAGGIGFDDDRFIVVGGLPVGFKENYAYEYDANFKFRKQHVIDSGYTLMGIQTATFHDGHWWFGCYGSPKILLKADRQFRNVARHQFDCSLGILGVAKGRFLVAKGACSKPKGCVGTVVPAEIDQKHGLAIPSR